jgi:hypothetical protein
MNDSIEARVARGADLLDKKVPNWCRRIDVGTLSLEDSCRCVLGQTFHDEDAPRNIGYLAGLLKLRILADPDYYGFSTTSPQNGPPSTKSG